MYEPPKSEAWESANQLLEHYSGIRSDLLRERGSITAIDFGSGHYGFGRMALHSVIQPPSGSIMLYDPFVEIEPSTRSHTRIVEQDEIPSIHPETIDWVNLTYVLSHLKTFDDAEHLLADLRTRFPRAVITVCDYLLKNRDRAHQLDVLTQSNAERKERDAMRDDEAFIGLHARHTLDSLLEVQRAAGYTILHAQSLGRHASRGLSFAQPS
jgi:hypothetical protein